MLPADWDILGYCMSAEGQQARVMRCIAVRGEAVRWVRWAEAALSEVFLQSVRKEKR